MFWPRNPSCDVTRPQLRQPDRDLRIAGGRAKTGRLRQQHECKRYLAHDQRVAKCRMRARRRAARPIVQCAIDVSAGREQRRDGSKQQSSQHRDREREREHTEIQADARERQIDEQPPVDELEHAERDGRAREAAGARDDAAVGERLTHQPDAARSKRRANGVLTDASGGANELQVRQVARMQSAGRTRTVQTRATSLAGSLRRTSNAAAARAADSRLGLLPFPSSDSPGARPSPAQPVRARHRLSDGRTPRDSYCREPAAAAA